MKNRRKIIFALITTLVVVGGMAIANHEIKNEAGSSPKPLLLADKKTRMAERRKKWDASPDGIKYKVWEVSSEGKKVHASHDKIRKQLEAFTAMEAVVTSVTFQRENAKPSPKWLIVRMEGETYMMQFIPKEFELLKSLKAGDTIIVRSHSAGYSPNHPYLIVSGDYIARNGKVLFKRDFSKNKGC